MRTPVLTIAGSDPSGGAGIQADLRVFAALGVVGVSAITALTVQNSQGVLSVHSVSADILFDQIEAILEDTRVRAVKIGMLGGVEQVRAVVEALRRFRPPNVVLDPVLASTDGVPLLDDAGRKLLLEELLPLCTLLTPNLAEASLLSGVAVSDLRTARIAGARLLEMGADAVLVKGGHLADEPLDTLMDREGHVLVLADRRIETEATHGTGCFLSSAIAAGLAKNLNLQEAVSQAKNLLTQALMHPVHCGRGRGYPDVAAAILKGREPGAIASSTREADSYAHSLRVKRVSGVYVLTDTNLRPDRGHIEIGREALAGGAGILQLRAKDLTFSQLQETAALLKSLALAHEALLIVNDRVDLALVADVDGVHLGPDDMRPEEARSLLGPRKLIGVSVSTVGEAGKAAAYASYFGVGAIFGSKTKNDAGPPIGLERIREIKQAFPDHPIVAIGGINAESIASVAEAGADAAAVVSAVILASDMRQATEELVRRFQRERARLPQPNNGFDA